MTPVKEVLLEELHNVFPFLVENNIFNIYVRDEIWYATRFSGDSFLEIVYDPYDGFFGRAKSKDALLFSEEDSDHLDYSFVKNIQKYIPELLDNSSELAHA